MIFRKVVVRSFEMGLKFRNGEFCGILNAGTHWIFDPFRRIQFRLVSRRDPWLIDDQLDLIVKSGLASGRLEVLDVRDNQRALVWIDGRFSRILGPGYYAYWFGLRDVRVEIIDTRKVQVEHGELYSIIRSSDAIRWLEIVKVERDCIGVLFIEGQYFGQLEPGIYAFWKESADVRVIAVDMRESQIDVSGQEIMTLDKVTLRMNALVTYRVRDARRALSAATDVRQSLYRDVQLALRAVVGGRELNSFMADKDEVTRELQSQVRERSESLGLDVCSVGIKDLILPGEMKDLLNRVTEAKTIAEANLIARREETAAIRSQANTAKLLSDNPTLMRLRELEVLEKVASAGKMSIVLGEKGLADQVVNLL